MHTLDHMILLSWLTQVQKHDTNDGRLEMTIGKPALFLGQIGLLHLLIVYHALSQETSATDATAVKSGKNVVIHDVEHQKKSPELKKNTQSRAQTTAQVKTKQTAARGDVLTPGAMKASAFYEEEGQMLADLDHGWSGQTTLDP